MHLSISFSQIFPKSILSINILWKALLMLSIQPSTRLQQDFNLSKICLKLMLKEKLLLFKQRGKREPKSLLKKKKNISLNLNLSPKPSQKHKSQLKEHKVKNQPKGHRVKSQHKVHKAKNQPKKEKNLLKSQLNLNHQLLLKTKLKKKNSKLSKYN